MSSEKISRREFLKISGWLSVGIFFGGLLRTFSPQNAYPQQTTVPTTPDYIVNGDFENGLDGWFTEDDVGSAFANQPVRGDSITAAEVNPSLVPIGGDYWKNTFYHLGYSGDYLIKSNPVSPGILYSSPFIITSADIAIGFLIGGNYGAVSYERFEERGAAGEVFVNPSAGEWRIQSQVLAVNPASSGSEAGTLIMREEQIPLQGSDVGKAGRIRVDIPPVPGQLVSTPSNPLFGQDTGTAEQRQNGIGVITVDHFRFIRRS